MNDVKIKLTLDEASELLQLVLDSCDTGNKDWDKKMKRIAEKIESSF